VKSDILLRNLATHNFPVKKISAVIPAYNEESRIEDVISRTSNYVDEVIIIDDNSIDRTAEVSRNAGGNVISNKENIGYIECIKKGFLHSTGDIIGTLDGDGEHVPDEIPVILKPIVEGKADLVLGRRKKISRISERFLNWFTNFKVKVEDSGTGFRAITKELALKLELKGKCTCGIFILEAVSLGANVAEVPVKIKPVKKNRRVAWHHFLQFFFILKWQLK